MAKAVDQPPGGMMVHECLARLEEGPECAVCELVAGDVVPLTPERAAHAGPKARTEPGL